MKLRTERIFLLKLKQAAMMALEVGVIRQKTKDVAETMAVATGRNVAVTHV